LEGMDDDAFGPVPGRWRSTRLRKGIQKSGRMVQVQQQRRDSPDKILSRGVMGAIAEARFGIVVWAGQVSTCDSLLQLSGGGHGAFSRTLVCSTKATSGPLRG